MRLSGQAELHALEQLLRTVVAAHDVHCQAHKVESAPSSNTREAARDQFDYARFLLAIT